MLTKDNHCLETTIDAEEVWQIIKNKIPGLRIEITTLLN